MISAEAPMLFSKAAEIFIMELTLRAWVHTEENKRRTLQRSDIAMAISKCDQFDFLIDIVPREETKISVARTTDTKPIINGVNEQVNVVPSFFFIIIIYFKFFTILVAFVSRFASVAHIITSIANIWNMSQLCERTV